MKCIEVSDPKSILLTGFWKNAKDELPNETGWYLVYAPKYQGGSSGGKEFCDGIMFSKFIRSKKGNTSWSVEMAGWNQNCVRFWMPLPAKPVCEDEPEKMKDIPGQLKFEF